MEQLIKWFQLEKDQLHPVELAAKLHFHFVYVHPFVNGNGRTAKLLMNAVLMSYGFPPAIVKAETLEMGSVDNQLEPFVGLIAECVEESLHRYIAAVTPADGDF